jgi:D-alanyl-lipoteichoic acid acyltransferase DltB (MBOAT superfamily)
MDITGFAYLVFFAAVLLLHRVLQGRHGAQKAMLVAASYYFYMTFEWRFALLLLALTLVNYLAGEAVARAAGPRARRAAVAAAVLFSLGVLFYFKYLNFFGGMANSLARLLGAGGSLVPYVDVLLPVGISFMTFQAITYPIDLYTGKMPRHCSLLDYSLFLAFFPRLLSGPIVRAAHFLPQLETAPPPVTDAQRFDGLALILRGVLKKALLADVLGAHLVDPAFANPTAYGSPFLWLALVGYSFQVYLDLSGYTDMALGAARMLGYALPDNFNRPYLATSIANFWQRWHITMSTFFRDYLYRPLAASWRAPVFVNLLLVFMAIGLWHGAGWTFILYGACHGTLVALERLGVDRNAPKPVYSGHVLVLRIAVTFFVVAVLRILFRSPDLAAAGVYAAALFRGGGAFPLSGAAAAALLAALALHYTPLRWRDQAMGWLRSAPVWLSGAALPAALYLAVAFSGGRGGFIYFQF